MNNKQLGTAFEREVCERLAEAGWWVHFMSPDNRGAQPFDIIAVRKGHALAGDCKTSSTNIFAYSRLEDNQKYAFERWIACGNEEPMVIVKYQEKILFVPYSTLKAEGKINCEDYLSANWLYF